MEQKATARDIYEIAFRNARCARSLDPRATLIPIVSLSRTEQIHNMMIIGCAMCSLQERREQPMGWFSITLENAFKLRKQQLVAQAV